MSTKAQKRKQRRNNSSIQHATKQNERVFRTVAKKMLRPVIQSQITNHGKRSFDRGVAKGQASSVAAQLRNGMRQGIGKTLREEPSAAAWPRVYVNPFLKMDARLPIWPVRATLCQFRQASIFAHCNEDGNGWATFWPANMIANDLAFVQYTDGPTCNSNIGIISGEPAETKTAFCGGQYVLGSFIGGGYAMRIVAWGFRVRYTGKELDKGGFITCHQMVPRASMDNLNSGSIQSTFSDWKQLPFNNKWIHFNRLYTENDDGLFLNGREGEVDDPWFFDDFDSASPENKNYISLYVNGATASVPFEIQVAGHYEIIGPLNNQAGVVTTTINTAKHEKVVNIVAQKRSAGNTVPDSGEGILGKIGGVLETGMAIASIL